MLNHAYHQIWRPCTSAAFVTDQYYSPFLAEDCGGYAGCENRLRAILTKAEKKGTDINDIFPGTYEALKKVTFELQEHVRQIFLANGRGTIRNIPSADIFLLEEPMRLSEYRCTICLFGSDTELAPFTFDADHELGSWYIRAPKFFVFPWSHHEAPLIDLVNATAALRCLLYAEFGPFSEQAISPARKKGKGTGYYTYKSIFTVIPPDWPEDEHYGFSYSKDQKLNVKRWSF